MQINGGMPPTVVYSGRLTGENSWKGKCCFNKIRRHEYFQGNIK